MPNVQVWINNALQAIDSTCEHDRYFIDYTPGVSWDPLKYYPGEDKTTQLKNGFYITLANPPKYGDVTSVNIYFWVNDGTLNSYSPAQYGCTIRVGTDGLLYIDNLVPGNLMPSAGIGKRYIALESSINRLNILNVKQVNITNNTGDDLPFFINYSVMQPVPVTLSDFPKSNSIGAIPKGGSTVQKIYNNVYPSNCGMYFYANNGLPTDSALAATTISMSDTAIQNISSTFKISNVKYSFNISGNAAPSGGGTSPPVTTPVTTTSSDTGSTDSSDSSSDKKSHVWLWVGISLGIVVLFVIIGLVVHFSSKKKTNVSSR